MVNLSQDFLAIHTLARLPTARAMTNMAVSSVLMGVNSKGGELNDSESNRIQCAPRDAAL